MWGRKPIGRRQQLTKRGRIAHGVVVHIWRGSRLIDGNRFHRAYAEVAYQTPWGQRTTTVRGLYRTGDTVRLLYDEQGAITAPD